MKSSLTPKQQQVLNFIQEFWAERNHAPTLQEIADAFHLRSVNSAQQYVMALTEKGYLKRTALHQKRALTLNPSKVHLRHTQSLPLCGYVAAGLPIETIEQQERIDVPFSFIDPRHENIVLRVRGESMRDEGIWDGDFIVIQKQPTAAHGQTVVALVDREATVKKLIVKNGSIELHPANPNYQPIIVRPSQEFHIEGVVVGLLRRMT